MSRTALALLALAALFALPAAHANPGVNPLDPISDITVLDRACVDPEGPNVSLSGGCAHSLCAAAPGTTDETCRNTMP